MKILIISDLERRGRHPERVRDHPIVVRRQVLPLRRNRPGSIMSNLLFVGKHIQIQLLNSWWAVLSRMPFSTTNFDLRFYANNNNEQPSQQCKSRKELSINEQAKITFSSESKIALRSQIIIRFTSESRSTRNVWSNVCEGSRPLTW